MDLTFIDIIASSQMKPFTMAVVFVIGILVLEVFMMSIGASMMGDADGDMDVDIDVDVDIDLDIDVDIDTEIAMAFGDTDIDAVDGFSVWGFLELGRVPLMIWILSMTTAFAVSGFFGQFMVMGVTGKMLPQLLAMALAIVPAFIIGRSFAVVFAKVVPKHTSDAVSRNSLVGTTGVITNGTATPTLPARARVIDKFGNSHNIQVIPFTGEPSLAQGTEILVLRGQGPLLRVMALHIAKQRHNS